MLWGLNEMLSPIPTSGKLSGDFSVLEDIIMNTVTLICIDRKRPIEDVYAMSSAQPAGAPEDQDDVADLSERGAAGHSAGQGAALSVVPMAKARPLCRLRGVADRQ